MQARITVFTTAGSQEEAEAVAQAVLKAARATSAFYPTVRLETRQTVNPVFEPTLEDEPGLGDGDDTVEQFEVVGTAGEIGESL